MNPFYNEAGLRRQLAAQQQQQRNSGSGLASIQAQNAELRRQTAEMQQQVDMLTNVRRPQEEQRLADLAAQRQRKRGREPEEKEEKEGGEEGEEEEAPGVAPKRVKLIDEEETAEVMRHYQSKSGHTWSDDPDLPPIPQATAPVHAAPTRENMPRSQFGGDPFSQNGCPSWWGPNGTCPAGSSCDKNHDRPMEIENHVDALQVYRVGTPAEAAADLYRRGRSYQPRVRRNVPQNMPLPSLPIATPPAAAQQPSGPETCRDFWFTDGGCNRTRCKFSHDNPGKVTKSWVVKTSALVAANKKPKVFCNKFRAYLLGNDQARQAISQANAKDPGKKPPAEKLSAEKQAPWDAIATAYTAETKAIDERMDHERQQIDREQADKEQQEAIERHNAELERQKAVVVFQSELKRQEAIAAERAMDEA